MASVTAVLLTTLSVGDHATSLILAADSDASSAAGGVFAAGLLTLVSLIAVIYPRGVWRVTTAWRYRNADAMEPSARYFRITRLSSAISLILWSSFFVAGVVPGDAAATATAALITACIGLAITVVLVVVSAIVRGIRRSRGRREEEPPVNELSEAGYADQYIGVGISAVALVVLMLILAGLPGQIEANRAKLEAESQARSDTMFGNYGVFYPNERPILGAPQPGSYVADPDAFDIADGAKKTPAYLWELRDSVEAIVGKSRTIDEAVAQSDVVLMSTQSCDVNALVIVESADTVAIGLEVAPGTFGIPGTQATAVPTPAPSGPSVAQRVCEYSMYGSPRGYYFVALPGGPLGDRTLTTLDGTPIPQGQRR